MKMTCALSLSLLVLLSGKRQIIEQIRALEQEHGVLMRFDEDLLNEVLNCRISNCFLGNFDAKILRGAQLVLVTSMKEHQRYLLCAIVKASFWPHFISVRNGNAEHLENVIKGMRKSWWLVWKMGIFWR